jgi:hypothetical protein
MVDAFTKNLLARRWADVLGFDNTASDANASSLAALPLVSYARVVDGRDGMRWL